MQNPQRPRPPAGPEFLLPQHIADHRPLVDDQVMAAVRSPAPWPRLDAVVVPAARTAAHLEHAITVARSARAHLLVLTSHETDPVEAAALARAEISPERVTVVDLPPGWRIPHLTLAADRAVIAAGRSSDTSVKRNLGILVALRRGWKRILFLDDDVQGFKEHHLSLVRSWLSDVPGSPVAVGFTVDEFPDNSVVCHGYRFVGGRQNTFLGGGALAVRVSPYLPHFPRMYNEDWLFLLALMLKGRSHVALAGTMEQLDFDPFELPDHAARQEVGDVLAEGLFALVHEGDREGRLRASTVIDPARTAAYWRQEIARRRSIVREIRAELRSRLELGRLPGRGAAAVRVERALDRALEVIRDDDAAMPVELARWVRQWRRDQAPWQSFLREQPTGLPGWDAFLGLDLKVL